MKNAIVKTTDEFEVRHTDWIFVDNILAFRGTKMEAYRIWHAYLNGLWFQRNEWLHTDHVISIEPWINTPVKFSEHATYVEYSLADFLQDPKKHID